MFFGHDLMFWLAVLGATLIKLFTSPFHSITRVIMTVFAALFAAYFFTEPALDYMQLEPNLYRNPVAALLALTGEGIMRLVIQVLNDPTRAVEWLKAWRSGK